MYHKLVEVDSLTWLGREEIHVETTVIRECSTVDT